MKHVSHEPEDESSAPEERSLALGARVLIVEDDAAPAPLEPATGAAQPAIAGHGEVSPATGLARLSELTLALTGSPPRRARPHEADGALQDLLGAEGVRGVLALEAAGVRGAVPPHRPHVTVAALETCLGDRGGDQLLRLLIGLEHPRRGSVLAVTGARGGLGATTLVLLLARALAECGRRVAVVDADPAGPLALLAGDGLVPGVRWADLPDEEEAYRPDGLVGALPTWRGIPLVSGDGRAGAPGPHRLGPVIEALRATHDVVLVDLPRGAPAPRDALVLLLSSLEVRSAVAAECLASAMAPASAGNGSRGSGDAPEVRLVVRPLGEDVTLEGLEALTGARVLGVLPHDRGLDARIARGEDPTRTRSALRRRAQEMARELLALLDADGVPVAAPEPSGPRWLAPAEGEARPEPGRREREDGPPSRPLRRDVA